MGHSNEEISQSLAYCVVVGHNNASLKTIAQSSRSCLFPARYRIRGYRQYLSPRHRMFDTFFPGYASKTPPAQACLVTPPSTYMTRATSCFLNGQCACKVCSMEGRSFFSLLCLLYCIVSLHLASLGFLFHFSHYPIESQSMSVISRKS